MGSLILFEVALGLSGGDIGRFLGLLSDGFYGWLSGWIYFFMPITVPSLLGGNVKSRPQGRGVRATREAVARNPL